MEDYAIIQGAGTHEEEAKTPEQLVAELAALKAEHFAGMVGIALDADQVSRIAIALGAAAARLVFEGGTLYVPADLVDSVSAIDADDDQPQRMLAAAEARRTLLGTPLETPLGATWCDAGTRTDIRETIAAIDDGLLTEPVAFKLASGFVQASRADLVALGQAIAQHVAAAFAAEAAEASA